MNSNPSTPTNQVEELVLDANIEATTPTAQMSTPDPAA
ncbi:hypothetical protein CANINC_000994, partial [Pichia inconspicua]